MVCICREATLFHSSQPEADLVSFSSPSGLLLKFSSHYSKLFQRLLFQAGGVAGCLFVSSCTITATSCWTTINRRMLEHTEIDIPRSKKKWKSQQDNRRGTITMNSNSIPTGWVTGEQKYQRSSSTIVKVLHLTSRNPACGSHKGTWNSLVI